MTREHVDHGTSTEGDVAYFAARASDERLLSRTASHVEAREAHLQMAQHYESLILAIRARQAARHAAAPLTTSA
jgi:adenosyl cobinamide kinase/adenosyl cobinamide phosphate guanylyltransferase